VERLKSAEPPLPPLGRTAVGVAAIRAAESDRPDRLFDDPYAKAFALAGGYVASATAPPASEEKIARRRGLISWVTVRTRFLDDLVLSASAGPCRQIVILGAGLDSRAFRLAWPKGTRLWELDLADVIEFKEGVIRAHGWQPRCERITVPIDLSEDWGGRLTGAGFDPSSPAAWLVEGLLAYLPTEVADTLVGCAAALSVPGSRMGLTMAATDRLDQWRQTHPDGARDPGDYVGLWQSTAPADPVGWLASHGWRAHLFEVGERSGAYGRPLDGAQGSAGSARLVDATRL
jgi:methyltransferase (TIGR00027 family)